MEFNVYVKTFDKIYELDTMPSHSIKQLSMYISKKVNMKDFIMIYLNQELTSGTVESTNIKEDGIIYIFPKIKSGINKKKENTHNKIVFSSID